MRRAAIAAALLLAGYRFPHAGCYRLTARRTVGSAEAWLRVRA